ncbi:MAG TPA: cupredoxin domain-containing protein [Candidatus Paceibacterota bacterium]
MNKTISIIITLALVVGIGIIFFGSFKSENNSNASTDGITTNSEIKNNIQYITINARGGYSPKVSMAKSGIPTKLIIKTNGTFDCSASLVIRSLGFRKILAQTGEEVIDIGIPKIGQPLQGICSMGMYNFLVKFI